MSDSLEDVFCDTFYCERPLGCSECKRQSVVLYSQVVGEEIKRYVMCKECPQIQRKLRGLSAQEAQSIETSGHLLRCASCQTTIDQIKVSGMVGCSCCYDQLSEMLAHELLSQGWAPERLAHQEGSESWHVGKVPQGREGENISGKLLALNDELKGALEKEEYEKAASLRDQIRELTQGYKGE